MEESKRQKQVGKLILEEMSDIFQREGVNVIDGGMVSVSGVVVTPDLLEARVYLSFFQVKNAAELLHTIRERSAEWRNLLGRRVRNQLRRVPDLQFYNDETLDYVQKMDDLFKKIEEDRQKGINSSSAE